MLSELRLHSGVSTRRRRGIISLDDAIPPLLRPLVRAYVLGYASAVAPRLLTLLLQCIITRKRKGNEIWAHRDQLLKILRIGFEWQRFPTFCALLIGGSALLEVRPVSGSSPISLTLDAITWRARDASCSRSI